MIRTLAVSILIASPNAARAATADACRFPNAPSLPADGRRVETAARSAAGDYCPDQAADADDRTKTDLLRRVRDRALERAKATTTADPDAASPESDADLRSRFERMRRFMALRRGRVMLSSDGRLEVVPDIQTSHAPGFAKLDKLTAAENEVIQSQMAPALAAANRAVQAKPPGPERRRTVTEEGARLRSSTVDAGEIGYERLIVDDPVLLFVGPDRDLAKARAAYRSTVLKEASALIKLRLDPNDGVASSLIFFGPIVTEVLRENPGLCGAFHGMRRKAEEVAGRTAVRTAAIGLAAVGTCLTSALVSYGILGAICVAAAGTELASGAYRAVEMSHQSQLLYGGAVAGAGTAEYESKRSELTGQLLASASSLTGVGATVRTVGTGLPKVGRYVELQMLLRQRQRLGNELNLAHVTTAPASVDGRPALRIAGDERSTESISRLAAQLGKDDYALEVSPFRHPSTLAVVDHEQRVVTIYGVNSTKALERPTLRGVVRHERRHIKESNEDTVASRINLQIKTMGPTDEATLGRYGSQIPFRGDEPFAFYDGAHAESTFSKGTAAVQTRYGHRVATRTAELLKDMPKDLRSVGLYDRENGLVFFEFKSDVKSHAPRKTLDTLRKLNPDRPDVGEYAISYRVKPGSDAEDAVAEAADAVTAYRTEVYKLRDKFDGQVQMLKAPR